MIDIAILLAFVILIVVNLLILRARMKMVREGKPRQKSCKHNWNYLTITPLINKNPHAGQPMNFTDVTRICYLCGKREFEQLKGKWTLDQLNM